MTFLQKQFLSCLQSYFRVNPTDPKILNQLSLNNDIIVSWTNMFLKQLYSSKNGYPLTQVYTEPVLENELLSIAKRLNLFTEADHRHQKPTICITHDVDNIEYSSALWLKDCINARKIRKRFAEDTLLKSLSDLLVIDKEISGNTNTTTVFIANRFTAKNLFKRITQNIIDPTYTNQHEKYKCLLQILISSNVEIGLHGSFFSITDNQLECEKKTLEALLGRRISSVRQHWLNLPTTSSFECILKSGFLFDSTLGWNANVGFRGGLTRPFTIETPLGSILEIPLLVMDSHIFNNPNCDAKKMLEFVKSKLEIVFSRQGCVAIDWHGRTANSRYHWHHLYKELLEWAANIGFEFKSIEAVGETYFA